MNSSGTPFITVVIPVYRVPKALDRLLESLLLCKYPYKEIIVIADEPTEETREILRKYSYKITAIINEERKGKVAALNEGLRLGRGDIFLFIDNDIFLPENSTDFFDILVEEMQDVDVAEINKEVVKDSFWARLIYYDYIAFQVANWLFSKSMKKTLGINGAIFAVKRHVFEEVGPFNKTVSEDLDFALRVFKKDFKFKFITRLKVYNIVYSDLKSWYNQRKRWAYGVASWVDENLLDLISISKRYPHIIIPAVYIILPTLIFSLMTIYTPTPIIISLGHYISRNYIPTINAPVSLFTLVPWIPMLLHASETFWGFVVYTIIFFTFSKKMKFKFNPVEFALYFFIYSPVWLTILLYGFVKVFIAHDGEIEIDWKV
ncbi:MAG: glycosyltransferase [Candidatus Asgardarchaeia archaeon]